MALFVGFVGFKGGAGKTILSFQMAERAQAAGLSVCVVDLDPEQSFLDHFHWRSRAELPVWPVEIRDINRPPAEELYNGALDQYDLVICDFAGFNSPFCHEYYDGLDLLLAPISNSPQDRTVTTRIGFLAQRRGWNFHFLVNCVAISSPLTRSVLSDLREGGFNICPVVVSRWNGFPVSSQWGYGVCEYEPDSRAAQQINRLWEWLDESLGVIIDSRLAAAV